MKTTANISGQSFNPTLQNFIQTGTGAGWARACYGVAGLLGWRAPLAPSVSDIGGARQFRHAGAVASVNLGCESDRLRLFWSNWLDGARGGQLVAIFSDGTRNIRLRAGLASGAGVSLGAALAAGVTIGAGAGSILGEIQAQMDLQLCRDAAARLLAKMRRQKIFTSQATADAGAADAAAVLAFCRARARRPFNARRVAWVWVSRSMSGDALGSSVQFFSPDLLGDLRASALPLPVLTGDDTRGDKVSRLLFERARAKRPALLGRRRDSLTAAAVGRGSDKRRAAIDRVTTAARQIMVGGAALDVAARAVGYADAGKWSAGDALLRAGLALVGDGAAKLHRGEFARGARFVDWLARRPYSGAPLPVALVRAWAQPGARYVSPKSARKAARKLAAARRASLAWACPVGVESNHAAQLARRVWSLPARGARWQFDTAGDDWAGADARAWLAWAYDVQPDARRDGDTANLLERVRRADVAQSLIASERASMAATLAACPARPFVAPLVGVSLVGEMDTAARAVAAGINQQHAARMFGERATFAARDLAARRTAIVAKMRNMVRRAAQAARDAAARVPLAKDIAKRAKLAASDAAATATATRRLSDARRFIWSRDTASDAAAAFVVAVRAARDARAFLVARRASLAAQRPAK